MNVVKKETVCEKKLMNAKDCIVTFKRTVTALNKLKTELDDWESQDIYRAR